MMTGSFVNYVTDTWGKLGIEREVTYATFARWAERGTARWWYEKWGFPLSVDPYISFHKSETPSGIPVVYFVWSHMEHFFIPDRDAREFSLSRETALAEELDC